MTPPKRNPTNADLMAEIRTINDTLRHYGQEITQLKEWRIAVEAAKEALKEVNASNARQTDNESISNKALAAVIGTIAVLGGIIAVMVGQ